MKSIQKSFANCAVCPLLNCPSCIYESNCEYMEDVDLVILAENPGKDEVKSFRPLTGKAGKMFRQYFEKHKLNKLNYFLTNVVLCQTLNPDGTTGNPDEEVINLCKENVSKFIEVCNPKLVLVMGASPMNAFNIGFFEMGNVGITKKRGNFFKEKFGEKVYDVLVTVHPSFVNRNRSFEQKFEDDIKSAYDFLTGQKTIEKTEVKSTGTKGMFMYKIPQKFYTDEYRLVDIQYLNYSNKVIYIFRDSNNKKIFHEESDRYIAYMASQGVDARKIVPYDQLDQISISYKDRYSLDPDITYEGDLKITTKHAIDYYLQSQGEAKKTNPNILYLDIEVDTGKQKVFPTPVEAKFPINLITVISTSNIRKKVSYILDNGTEPIQPINGAEFKIFKNEKSLLTQFVKDFPGYDCDYVCGWNLISFDMEYIFNRLKNLKMNPGSLSPFNSFYVDGSRYVCQLPGYVPLDQLYLYKMFTFTKMENYKLGFIAQAEIKETKIELPLAFNEMYWKMLNKTIEYNIRDVELLEKLENKLKHMNLLDELRLICTTSFDSCSGAFGQIDSIVVSFLKKKGLASKNSNPHIQKDKYPGAFVYEPKPGIYNYITDFDFTSLYPSIIMTYNIGANNFKMKLKDQHLGYDIIYRDFKDWPEKIEVIIDPVFKEQKMVVTKDQLKQKLEESNLIPTINGCFYSQHEKEKSVYSEILEGLISSRKKYKKKMLEAKEIKDEDNKNLYDTKQLVYKVLANSLYGVIANKAFRFFDVSCAAAITLSGQEALKNSIIYGDIFIESIKTKTEIKEPKALTKEEIYADVMPDRKTKYIVTGDTDSLFCTFASFKEEEKTNENIKKWCDLVQNYLNNDIVKSIVKKHNVDLKYNKLELKNELIITRGLFLAKKRYAINITNQEGKNVDEVKYMGLEIKRSDYPAESKAFLKELLDIILKSNNYSPVSLMQFIDRKKHHFVELIKAGDKRIARPVSYTKDISEFKSVSQGVKAMEAFNEIAYKIHHIGDKAYLFFVNGIDESKAPKEVVENYNKFISKGNKLDAIAIPDNEVCLPNYFNIDVKKSLKFCFEDRYSLLLAPLFEVKKNEGILTI